MDPSDNLFVSLSIFRMESIRHFWTSNRVDNGWLWLRLSTRVKTSQCESCMGRRILRSASTTWMSCCTKAVWRHCRRILLVEPKSSVEEVTEDDLAWVSGEVPFSKNAYVPAGVWSNSDPVLEAGYPTLWQGHRCFLVSVAKHQKFQMVDECNDASWRWKRTRWSSRRKYMI